MDMAATTPKRAMADGSIHGAIPAGMIQPPLFDRAADPAVNFGGLGNPAAQKLIHGFDTFGSQYDERGNVHDWWSPDDRKKYAAAMTCEVAQIGQAVPQSDDAPRPVNNFAVADSTPTTAPCASLFGRSWRPWMRKGRNPTPRAMATRRASVSFWLPSKLL